MIPSSTIIPVVLFAYARPEHLARVLSCLRENAIPLIYAFADGAKGSVDSVLVDETRAVLRGIDWCEVRLVERPQNLGLGRNVIAGVTEVAALHDMFVVWEDDLICVPGTYDWMCGALRHYADNLQVMSVTAWNHPRLIPSGSGGEAYFDGRGECWVWGAYARSWVGMMEENAIEKMAAAQTRGVAPTAYGYDLPEMARIEQEKNIWAVRWVYHHLQHDGLSLRPPWSMVEHIGFDAMATNAGVDEGWANKGLRLACAIPSPWPPPKLNPECAVLWRKALPPRWRRRANSLLRRLLRRIRP